MIRNRGLVGGLALVGFVFGAPWPLGAEELRPALNVPMILNLLALPMDRPEAAFQESLRAAPASRVAPEWRQLEDGSYRYGDSRLTVIIKNPCPDGTVHTPLALPGRR